MSKVFHMYQWLNQTRMLQRTCADLLFNLKEQKAELTPKEKRVIKLVIKELEKANEGLVNSAAKLAGGIDS